MPVSVFTARRNKQGVKFVTKEGGSSGKIKSRHKTREKADAAARIRNSVERRKQRNKRS